MNDQILLFVAETNGDLIELITSRKEGFMTETQVSYANVQELQKHNRATELQAQRELEELSRHNVAGESYSFANLEELKRHQQAVEQETKRANLANERLKDIANQLSLTTTQLTNAARIQAAGISANASVLIAKLNNHTNQVLAQLNNASREEITRLNNLANQVIQDQSIGLGTGKLNLDEVKQQFAEDTWAYKVLFGEEPLSDLPGKVSSALGTDYLGAAAGKAVGKAN